MKGSMGLGVTGIVFGLLLAGCPEEKKDAQGTTESSKTAAPPATAAATAKPAAVDIDPALVKAFGALPDVFDSKENPVTDDKVALGKELFFDVRMGSGDVSCNSCHGLDTYGVDNKKVSEGHKKKLGARNSPSVYNAAGHFVQFWDGREPTVEAQALKPILNPDEMAMPAEKDVLTAIKKDATYAEKFKKAFPGDKDPMTFANIGKAIGAFERKLVTPAKWDRFAKGDKTAMSADEKAGFKKFVEVGCVSCHTGPQFGGIMYQKLGLVIPWPKQDDLGRFKVTNKEEDKMMFKVPSLRNIEKTAPYFHDGSTADLGEATKLMAKHQLGKDISDADTNSIVTFLKALTGDIPKDLVAPPAKTGAQPTNLTKK
ncbi:MAG: cytochrome c peroxidase [Polyangiaceae bacterium]